MSIADRISTELFVRKHWVSRVIARAPHAYKEYRIKKKSGGYREIAQPARETKRVQYWVIENVLSEFDVHDCAFGYVQGKSIKLNAEQHKHNQYIAKLDIENFFTSITEDHVTLFFKENTKFDDNDISILLKILLRRKTGDTKMAMTIGAPSSPTLSNILLCDLDREIYSLCAPMGITYTRYADDMSFSTNTKEILFQFSDRIIPLITKYKYGDFRINQTKTIFRSKRNSRRITGLCITNEEKVSLGRARKREISAMIHHYKLSKLDKKSIIKLKGLLAFALDVEPLFVARMKTKYSQITIDKIMKEDSGNYRQNNNIQS
ncbi:retron St85 family RNA-directed DNA polymerase [Halioxenophilus aromaticivorans]